MNLMECIKADWKEFVRVTPMNEDLRKSLIRYWPQTTLMKNLASELRKKKNLKRTEIKLAVYSFSQWFVNLVEAKAKERRMSDLDVIAKNLETQKREELMKEASDHADSVQIQAIPQKKNKN